MWRFPRRIPHTTQVIDHEDLNDGFLPLVAASGHLGEGNWQDDMSGQLNAVTEVDNDIAYRTSYVQATSYCGGPIASATNETRVAVGPGWTRVGALTRTLDVEAGPVIAVASFQHGKSAPGDGNDTLASRAYVHVNYGIRVDGNVVPVSVVGDQDRGNAGDGMEFGIWNYLQGIDIFVILDVPPGRHTFEVVVTADAELLEATDYDEVIVYNREFVVVEVK